jgi:hypothetical protein
LALETLVEAIIANWSGCSEICLPFLTRSLSSTFCWRYSTVHVIWLTITGAITSDRLILIGNFKVPME